MSKRILAVALALGILATSNAFASRSRTAVLGTGDGGMFLNGGSFFYDDARNIFYNPSYVNDFKNWGIIEKNAAGAAEGGFVTSLGSFNLGVYLNRISSLNNGVATMGSAANQRPIELFFGGDMSNMKWGLGLNYASSKATSTTTDTNLILSAGVQVADFEPFGWISLIGKEGSTADTKYSSMAFGLRYKMGEWLPYAGWRQDKVVDTKEASWLVGVGRTTKIGEGARMNYALSVVRNTQSGGGPSNTRLPLDVSVEADANSWLTARAGLNHNLIDRSGDVTAAANTTGRVGLGFHAGKADIDFSVGSTAGAEDLDHASTDLANGFFTQVGVGYHW